ncbi:MAG: S-layer homology domain-containing protein, partial [Promicromonosporaceae bacterium]|nr:S-layer homology domain-containing protein [Promicromonosporaceae bacterium]
TLEVPEGETLVTSAGLMELITAGGWEAADTWVWHHRPPPPEPEPTPEPEPEPLPEEPELWFCPTTATFTDVTTEATFHCYIEWLNHTEITTGWPDNTFRPVAPVERQAMAAFLYRALATEGVFQPPTQPTFIDKTPEDTFFRQIEWLNHTGITTGWPDGTFRPGQPIERQAMAAFLYRAAGEPDFRLPRVPAFSDVPRDSQFYREIEWLARTGITTGFPDGTFRPEEPIERQAIAAFLYRAITGGHITAVQ